MRTIIIGDVHGCDAQLRALLGEVAPAERDTLVMLGDLFDRGPDSYEVFRTVEGLASSMGERFILLRGNHEDYLLTPKLPLFQRMVWDRVGRGATVASFKAHGERIEAAVPFLQARCRLSWKGERVQCVHAGLLIDPPEANDRNTLIHDHTVVLQNRYAGPLTVVGHIALDAPTYFAGDGETTERLRCGEWLPLPAKGIICIDTGCGKGGSLTAMIVKGDAFSLVSAK